MKICRLIILLAGILFSVNCTSQGIRALPDSNATWIIEENFGGPGANWNWIYYTNSDTLINSLLYTKLYCTCPQIGQPPLNSGLFVGSYRNDSTGKLFYIPKDSIGEIRLYD